MVAKRTAARPRCRRGDVTSCVEWGEIRSRASEILRRTRNPAPTDGLSSCDRSCCRSPESRAWFLVRLSSMTRSRSLLSSQADPMAQRPKSSYISWLLSPQTVRRSGGVVFRARVAAHIRVSSVSRFTGRSKHCWTIRESDRHSLSVRLVKHVIICGKTSSCLKSEQAA